MGLWGTAGTTAFLCMLGAAAAGGYAKEAQVIIMALFVPLHYDKGWRTHKVIPPANLKKLDTWCYTGTAPNYIDSVVMQPWWEFVARLMPRWLAPNIITLCANSCNTLACVLTLSLCPDLVCTGPRWLYFVLPLLNFGWQTLDAVDGKHARNTGSSSPLGCLFDHGLDGLTWAQYFVPIIGAMQWGVGTTSMVVFFNAVTFITYVGYWSARYSGELMWEGTESQLIIMALYLAIGVVGPEVLTLTLAGPVDVRTAVLWGGLFGPVRTMLTQFRAVANNAAKPEGALRELLSASVVYGCFALLFARMPEPASEHFVLLFTCFNLATSHLINKSIVYDVAEMPADSIEWLALPTLALVYISLTRHAADMTSALQVFLLIMAYVWLHFVCRSVQQITAHLNIKLLSIPYKKAA